MAIWVHIFPYILSSLMARSIGYLLSVPHSTCLVHGRHPIIIYWIELNCLKDLFCKQTILWVKGCDYQSWSLVIKDYWYSGRTWHTLRTRVRFPESKQLSAWQISQVCAGLPQVGHNTSCIKCRCKTCWDERIITSQHDYRLHYSRQKTCHFHYITIHPKFK